MINEVNSNTSPASSSNSGNTASNPAASNNLSNLISDILNPNTQKAITAASSLSKLVSSGSPEATSQSVQLIQSQVSQTTLENAALEKLLTALLSIQNSPQLPNSINSDIKTVLNNANKNTVLRSIIENLLEFS